MPPRQEEKAISRKANHWNGHMSTSDQHISDIWTTCAQQVMRACTASSATESWLQVLRGACDMQLPQNIHWCQVHTFGAPTVALNAHGSLTVAPKATSLPF
jgi:hypothetical protein